ncbi:hypothetical protein [Streptomyces sp. NPDC002172]
MAGPLKTTARARARCSSQRAIVSGIALMGTACLPPLIGTGTAPASPARRPGP